MYSLYENMDEAQILNAFPAWKQMVDRELHGSLRDVFHYRGRKEEWPSEGLQDRLEKSFALFLLQYHQAKAEATVGNVLAADQAYNTFRLECQKVDWSFQKQLDPEGPDMPWGVRTIVNDYPNQYSVKSMEAYATAELYGFIGFDEYADVGLDMKKVRPEGMTDEDALESANAYVTAQAVIYELDESRVSLALEILDEAPKTMRPLEANYAASSVPGL